MLIIGFLGRNAIGLPLQIGHNEFGRTWRIGWHVKRDRFEIFSIFNGVEWNRHTIATDCLNQI